MRNASEFESIVDQLAAQSLPFESVWTGKDAMSDFRSFTWDQRIVSPALVDLLRKRKIRLVATIGTGISIDKDGNDPYNTGKRSDVFVKASSSTEQDLVGQAESGEVAYPDFLKSATCTWWRQQLEAFDEVPPLDGVVAESDELANPCSGFCRVEQAGASSRIDLPYIPLDQDLNSNSVPYEAFHHDGSRLLNTHNLLGALQAQATAEWYSVINRKGLIMVDNGFAGTARFASVF